MSSWLRTAGRRVGSEGRALQIPRGLRWLPSEARSAAARSRRAAIVAGNLAPRVVGGDDGRFSARAGSAVGDETPTAARSGGQAHSGGAHQREDRLARHHLEGVGPLGWSKSQTKALAEAIARIGRVQLTSDGVRVSEDATGQSRNNQAELATFKTSIDSCRRQDIADDKDSVRCK